MRAARHTADIRPQEEEATILDALRAFERDGYTGQFAAKNNAQVECLECHKSANAADIPLQGAHRLEGTSDPDDEVLVAALACPHCGAHGTVVLKYGPTAPAEDLEVLAALRDERGEHPLDPK